MNVKFSPKARQIMDERFGRDTLIALATADANIPNVRTVNAYYENGIFYIITHAQSNKMKQIAKNPNVGICGNGLQRTEKASAWVIWGEKRTV